MKTILIHYTFELPQRESISYEIKLNTKTLSLISEEKKELPFWTKLEVGQCSNCPLKKEETPHCPIAVNLVDLFERFKDEKSYVIAKTTITTEERTFVKEAPLQRGLFSIFGIIMATSNCPRMKFLKPMAKFHLPFATSEETIIRSVSMYLLRQYFEHKKGNQPDMHLLQLEEQYHELMKVNKGMVGRLKHIIKSGDANQNAVIILDAICQMLAFSIDEKLESFEYLFNID